MSDSRKYIDEQFDKFFEFDTEDRSTVTSTSCKLFAEHCIQQLLAVIAKKDEALIKACELIEKFSLQVHNGSDCLRIYNAVELQPTGVELVEVGKVKEVSGTLFASSYQSEGAAKIGDAVYTIKTKE